MPTRPLPALVGIDLGTSSIKVAAFDLGGRLVALHRCDTPTWRGPNGLAEHDPDLLWQTTLSLLKKLHQALGATASVEAIACTSVGEAGMALDHSLKPVRPAIAWFDARAGAQAEFWKEAVGMDAVNRVTGQAIDPHYGANKLLWMRAHEPQAFAATRKWVSLADFIILQLSGAVVTDRSLASRTLLFDQRRLSWSRELLKAADLDPSLMPDVEVAGTRIGALLPAVAEHTGLRAGTPIALAGHDRPCGAFAARGGQHMAIDSTGSAEAIVLPIDNYVERTAEEAGFVACYADVTPDHYIFSARVGYAGALVDWFRREFGESAEVAISSESLEAGIRQPLQPSGLLVYPSFGRALAPAWNASTRAGAILGLTLAHGRADIYQALIEGVCFSLRGRLDWLETLSEASIDVVRVEGGVVRSDIWLQLKADITGRAVDAVLMEEPTALGAALLAGVAVGAFPDHHAAARSLSPVIKPYAPDPSRSAHYATLYDSRFRKLPDLLAALSES
jgi:xylulokinase